MDTIIKIRINFSRLQPPPCRLFYLFYHYMPQYIDYYIIFNFLFNRIE